MRLEKRNLKRQNQNNSNKSSSTNSPYSQVSMQACGRGRACALINEHIKRMGHVMFELLTNAQIRIQIISYNASRCADTMHSSPDKIHVVGILAVPAINYEPSIFFGGELCSPSAANNRTENQGQEGDHQLLLPVPCFILEVLYEKEKGRRQIRLCSRNNSA
jgi:hypothetical protein